MLGGQISPLIEGRKQPYGSTESAELDAFAARLMAGVEIKRRRYMLQSYDQCFVGREAVKWMLETGEAQTENDAVALGELLHQNDYIRHVCNDHTFKNGYYFYRFIDHEDHGSRQRRIVNSDDDDEPTKTELLSWNHIAGRLLPFDVEEDEQSIASMPSMASASSQADDTIEDGVEEKLDIQVNKIKNKEKKTKRILQPLLASQSSVLEVDTFHRPTPLDQWNIDLLDKTHPVGWINPDKDIKYHCVVIGAGAGGLVSAAGIAGVGGRVAIIEEELLGGDCLNWGCVPSKALIRSATAIHEIKENAAKLGIEINGTIEINFNTVMERMRKIRSDIAENDSAVRFSRKLGVDVYFGHGKFKTSNTIEVNGSIIKFQKAIIATGGRAKVPNIPGLSSLPYLTNQSLFNLTELPEELLIIGGGPIGLEMAQSFARFGSKVKVILRHDRILRREDIDAVKIVYKSLINDGVEFYWNCDIDTITFQPDINSSTTHFGDWKIRLKQDYNTSNPLYSDGDDSSNTKENDNSKEDDNTDEKENEIRDERAICGTALLISVGRKPNTTNLGLEDINVDFDSRNGIIVNNNLRTSQKNIYAVGDCCTKYQFTHVADFMARLVIRNAFFFGNGKFDSLIIPWCTYTKPEIAHVGLYESDLQHSNTQYTVYEKHFSDVDRAICDEETEGFVRILCKGKTDEILGATIVGKNAGDLISEITVAIQHKIGLGGIARVIHPYPTSADAIRGCGDLYNKTRLTPIVRSLLRGIMKSQR